ncbi:MAG: cytochrome c biogenesis protein CcdA [Acidimicrobiia bacterium]
MEIAGVSILAAFVFGVLSFLSPCVLPLLPGYLAMMSGYSVTEVADGSVSTRRMLRVTLLFVLGFTVVFVALGATATAVGSSLLRNAIDIGRIAGWFVLAMGLFLVVTGIWAPGFMMGLMRERRADVWPSRLGVWAPPVMGAAFGFAWTPCIGPTLGAILTVAGTQSTVAAGMVLLFAYSLGLGVPFVLAGVGIGRLYGAFEWLRRRARVISVVSGALLMAFGVLMITGGLFRVSSWFQRWLPDMFWNV